MNNIVCAIAKNENMYVNEWCHHYLNIGFSHIYLYDNNNSTTEYVGNFIDDNIKDKVTILDWRDRKVRVLQFKAYQDCYDNNDFDWCLYCDLDEFLMGIDNINEFLSQDKFKTIEQIKIQWKLFGDNDCIERDLSIPVVKFFTKEAITQGHPMVKSIVRGKVPGLTTNDCHIMRKNIASTLITCFPSGKLCSKEGCKDLHTNPPDDYTGETVFINHYITKTLAEFLENKYMLDDPCFICRYRTLEYFWRYNEKTPEKEAYLKKFLEEHNLITIDKRVGKVLSWEELQYIKK